jgi:hypothetical protein
MLAAMASWRELLAKGGNRVPEMPASEHGEAVLAQAVAAYRAALGSRLIAGYALGSLAHGGFSPLVSDVDLALILAGPLRLTDRLTIRSVAGELRAGGSALHERLSVFWGTRSTLQGHARGGRFPPLDRLDLLVYGRLLTGADARHGLPRPGQAELLTAGAEFALGSLGGVQTFTERLQGWARRRPQRDRALDEIRAPALLVSRGPRRLTKLVLFPVRFLFTAATGQVGTNALAAEHYLAGASPAAAELIMAALEWRREPPADQQAAADLLGRELIPLYARYLDDHIERLRDIGQHGLADSFRQWRARLLA